MNLSSYLPEITENNISKDRTISLYETNFGDGYAQVGPAGINHIRNTYIVTIPSMTRAQRNTLSDFFINRGGYNNFAWVPAGDITSRLWKCEDWKFQIIAPEWFQCTFTIIESFDLGEDI